MLKRYKYSIFRAKTPSLRTGFKWVYGENLVVQAGMPASGCTSRAVESAVDLIQLANI